MQKNKGISLIVLVITMIVLVIIAGAVIASFGSGNVTSKTEEMKFKVSISDFAEELSNYISAKEHEYTAKGKVYDGSSLIATKDYLMYDGKFVEGQTILDLIPSLKKDEDENYDTKLKVENGQLKYIAEYDENAGVITKTENNNDTEALWANGIGVQTTNEYTKTSNIMRTELFESAQIIGPHDTATASAEKINDGIYLSSQAPGTQISFARTQGAFEHSNIGFGAEINFSKEIALKKFNLYSYTIKATEFTVEAYVNEKWKTVYIHTASATKSPHVIEFEDNEVRSNKWKIYVSKVSDSQSNFYAYEIEAYM